MEGTDLAKIVMNPVRIRIAQYLILHEQGTTAQIGEELSDVPKASLYRHMKMLEDAGLIQVVQENSAAHTQLSSEYYGRISAVSEAGGCGPAEGYDITDIRGFSPVRRRISGVFRETG